MNRGAIAIGAAAPLCLDNAARAYLAYDAADTAFNWHVQTGQGDGPALLSARTVAYANYLNASRKNRECAQ